MAADYKKYDFKIFESLVNIRSELTHFDEIPEINDIISHVEEIKTQVESKRIRVAMVGEFKRGKSSLINALLGSEILPADIEPTTAAVNRVTYGSIPKAYIRFKNDSVVSVNVDDLSSYITKLTSESAQIAKNIEEAVVEYPSALCQNYVDIIDTPGMNDEDDMSMVTLNELRDIDLAVAVLSAAIPVSETEGEFLARIVESEGINDIVIVITHIDYIRREEDRQRIVASMTDRIKEKVIGNLRRDNPPDSPVFEKYDRIFNKLNVFAVSSADALDAMKFNNSELLEKSGITEINRMLPQIIFKNQNNNAIFNAVKEIKKIQNEFAYVTENFGRTNSVDYSVIISAQKEVMQIVDSMENISWQYSEKKTERFLKNVSTDIALMFVRWTKIRKPNPRRIRRMIKKQKKEVLKFMTQYMNYFFYNDTLNDAYYYIYNTVDSYLGRIEKLSEKYSFMCDIGNVINEERKQLVPKVPSEQPCYRCRWMHDPTPNRVMCYPDNKDRIYEYLGKAVHESILAVAKKMQENLKSTSVRAANDVIKKEFIVKLRQHLDKYFVKLRENNDAIRNEFNQKKLNIEKKINASVYTAEEVAKELLTDINA